MTLAHPAGYRQPPPGTHPPLDYPGYKSTALRAPSQAPIVLPNRLTEVTGPLLTAGHNDLIGPSDHDLTTQHAGEPIGQRIVVFGRVLDSDGRPVPDTLVEVWQANASGRYPHKNDNWAGALDPKARQRMLSTFDLEAIRPEWALAYRWDIVLRGREQTPFEEPHE